MFFTLQHFVTLLKHRYAKIYIIIIIIIIIVILSVFWMFQIHFSEKY